ncbi:bifunctional phosphoribosylaminoimidazolecarboxamide formyltransferase/IMP cyclohydrolase [Candidatus Micrarchaeota archaeon]|nr:bifunctional phosphoribosylaminoimidazolecarboxamide formyltransferase/IMP cyclohydrolase [Candidatus Micrarchaeota archaeon]
MDIKRALISVYNKEGVVEFARFLSQMGVEILSSGGTFKLLSQNHIPVIEVSKYTGSPELMDGRVKTLHPKIHGAILADRSNPNHMQEAEKNGIVPIDLVAVNLYPFEESALKNAPLAQVIEHIDIGGPTLLRSAAKNYKNVAVICNPSSYSQIMSELKESKILSPKTHEKLAVETWTHVSHYDVCIERYFRNQFGYKDEMPEYLNLTFHKKQDLRYGENPHQASAVYKDDFYRNPSILDGNQIQGKQMSYNNILDCNAAFKLIREFEEPTAVIVKHNNPCGVASAQSILDAYKTAKAVDPEAAFGGIVFVNRPVDEPLAKEITSRFVEIVVSPNFTPEALEIFKAKKNIRVIVSNTLDVKRQPYRKYRSILGGLLVQEANVKMLESLKTVTKREPTKDELQSLLYAWKVVKYVKSNAIVYAKGTRVIAIGAGQMKRIDAARIGSLIAQDYGESLKGAVMASDAFFPFRDGIDFAAKLGITAIIQPGGSVKDEEVIAASNEHKMAMVFTGIRHFRH